MRYLIFVVTLLGMLAMPGLSYAEDNAGARGWFSLGGGFAGGDIDLPCAEGQPAHECSEDGILPSLTLAATLGTDTLIRFRSTWLLEDEGNDSNPADKDDPQELALTIGSRLGNSPWAMLIGAGRVLHPDDDYPGREDGVALEFVFAPRAAKRTSGFEMGIHFFKSRDLEGGGIQFAARFGRLD